MALRELLERAVPVETATGPSSSWVRATGDRRARRARAGSALAGVGAVVAALALVAWLVSPERPAAPPSGPAPVRSSESQPPLPGVEPRGLAGSRWAVLLDPTLGSTMTSLPGDSGRGPTAMLVLGSGRTLALLWTDNGTTTTIAGRWAITSSSATVESYLVPQRGLLRMTFDEPPDLPQPLEVLLIRMELSDSWSSITPPGRPRRPYLAPLWFVGTGAAGPRFVMEPVAAGAHVPGLG